MSRKKPHYLHTYVLIKIFIKPKCQPILVFFFAVRAGKGCVHHISTIGSPAISFKYLKSLKYGAIEIEEEMRFVIYGSL